MDFIIDRQVRSRTPEREVQPDDEAHRYYLANKEGIDSWNDYVAERGLPLAEYSDF